VNRKSEAFIRDALMRIELLSPQLPDGHWGRMATTGCVPSSVTRAKLCEWVVNALVAQREIRQWASCALKELEFNGSGVFPVGAIQGELSVDVSETTNKKGE